MDALPLTFEQRMMHEAGHVWGLSWWQLVPIAATIEAELDVRALRRATTELGRRHQVLGLRLVTDAGDPAQELGDAGATEFALLELEAGDSAEFAATLQHAAQEPFDLAREPPLRVAAAWMAGGQTALMVVGHHLFLDLPSVQTLLADLVDLYLHYDRLVGAPYPPAPDGPTFADYARRQAEHAAGDALERQLAHWQRELEGAEPGLGASAPESDPAASALAAIPFALAADDSARALAYAREQGVTPFALAAAATYGAVRELSGRDDVVVAVATSTRRAPFERTPGQFADLFFLRQRPASDPLGREHLQAIRRSTLAGMARFVPSVALRAHVPWLRERAEQGLVPCSTVLNYLPGGAGGLSGVEEATWPADLGARVHEQPVPVATVQQRYAGLILFAAFTREQPTLEGVLQYETSVLGPAKAAAAGAALTRLAPVG